MGRKKKNISVFQAHLPFKSRVPQRRAIAVPFVLEKRALTVLASGLLLLVILYSYFVMLSVSHVALREQILYDSEKLASEVASLEQEYLARSVLITEETALAHGFTRSKRQLFVERSSLAQNLAAQTSASQ